MPSRALRSAGNFSSDNDDAVRPRCRPAAPLSRRQHSSFASVSRAFADCCNGEPRSATAFEVGQPRGLRSATTALYDSCMTASTLVSVASALSFASLLTLAACTVNQTNTGAPKADAGGVANADAGSGAVSSALTCLAIIQCIVECPDADAACPDACFGKGSPTGQSNAEALAVCIDKQKCADETCLQAKCMAPLEACVTSSATPPSGKPLQGNVPPGSVPSDMVGSFVRANYGTTVRLTLKADGTGSYQVADASRTSGCFSTTSTTDSGNAVVTSDTIKIYATEVLVERKVCSSPIERENGTPTTIELKYTRKDADTLAVVDQVCAAKYPDSEYSQGFYCTERLVRE